MQDEFSFSDLPPARKAGIVGILAGFVAILVFGGFKRFLWAITLFKLAAVGLHYLNAWLDKFVPWLDGRLNGQA